MTPPLWQKVKKNQRASWWKWKSRVKKWVKREWKRLKTQHSENEDHGIWSHHFMANRLGKQIKQWQTSFFGLQNHCRWWLQSWNLWHLVLGRKAMTHLDSILKKQRLYFAHKLHLVKAMIFPVVLYGCESWILKNTDLWRIDAFELSCWRRLLRVPWTARRSNQSTLKEIFLNIRWKHWYWSWNTNTLATWCEELTHWKRPWWWERLKVGGEGDNRGWDSWMHHQLNGHDFE